MYCGLLLFSSIFSRKLLICTSIILESPTKSKFHTDCKRISLVIVFPLCCIKYTSNSNSFFVTSIRSEEHTSELQSRFDLVCRLLWHLIFSFFPYTTLFRSCTVDFFYFLRFFPVNYLFVRQSF